MVHSDSRSSGDSIRTRQGLARLVKYWNGLESPADEAYRWAIEILEEAGYPREPGTYRIRDHSIEQVPPEESLSGWNGPLAAAVVKLGHERGSDLHRAAQLLDLFSNAQHYIDKGDARTAMRLGVRIGQLWEERLRDADALAGRKLRLGGRPEAKAAADQERHGRWFLADMKLRQEQPGLSSRERAKVIGEAVAVSPETVRAALRKMWPPTRK